MDNRRLWLSNASKWQICLLVLSFLLVNGVLILAVISMGSKFVSKELTFISNQSKFNVSGYFMYTGGQIFIALEPKPSLEQNGHLEFGVNLDFVGFGISGAVTNIHGVNLTKEVRNLKTNCNESDCDPVTIFDFNFDVNYENQDNEKSNRWSTISMALDLTTSPKIEINSIQVWSLSYRNLKFDLFLKVTLSFITMVAIHMSQWYQDRSRRESNPIYDLQLRKIIFLLILQTIYLVPYRTFAFCWGYELPYILIGQLVTWFFYYIFALYVFMSLPRSKTVNFIDIIFLSPIALFLVGFSVSTEILELTNPFYYFDDSYGVSLGLSILASSLYLTRTAFNIFQSKNQKLQIFISAIFLYLFCMIISLIWASSIYSLLPASNPSLEPPSGPDSKLLLDSTLAIISVFLLVPNLPYSGQDNELDMINLVESSDN